MARTTTATKTNKTTSTTSTKPSIIATVTLIYGTGSEDIKFSSEKELNLFTVNVTKRNLNAYPYEIVDATGAIFIIRSFLFCKIIRH